MPPTWLPLATLLTIAVASALRVIGMQQSYGVKALGFGRRALVQRVAERGWKVASFAAVVFATIAWLAPSWEVLLGRPSWGDLPALKWVATALFAGALITIVVAQAQMGASWRIGVPAEGPGSLVAHGLFRWSRNPTFAGMIAAALALFLWSPHLGTAALLTAAWTLALIQVRIEEEALRDKHGDAYERYAAQVGRWFGRRALGRRLSA